jgi:coenzyme F420-reducing hydrogenase alpha subunit
VPESRTLRIPLPALGGAPDRAALWLRVEGGRVADLWLEVAEPPRFFERLVEGYTCDQAVDLLARVAGTCPVAHQLTAVMAFERLFRWEPDAWVTDMRRVLCCGEWLRSHAAHLHLVALPDHLGCDDAVALARRHPGEMRRGLLLHEVGSAILRLLGGRTVHPVGLRVGGFHRVPPPAEVAALVPRLEGALPETEALVRWVAELAVPQGEQPFTSVALGEPDEYAMAGGRIQSGDGLDIAVEHFESEFEEQRLAHSTAPHVRLDRRPYLVGPLARLNLNFRELPAAVRVVMDTAGIRIPSHNTFHSHYARAVEMLLAVHDALAILRRYELPDAPWRAVEAVPGTACHATEAPRGLLWERLEVDSEGRVRRARLVTPTAQNLARCEQDLRNALDGLDLDRGEDAIRRCAERVVRNYDPCLACATH